MLLLCSNSLDQIWANISGLGMLRFFEFETFAYSYGRGVSRVRGMGEGLDEGKDLNSTSEMCRAILGE